MTWTVIVAKAAQKQLAGFPAKDQGGITAAIGAMADDPFRGDIRKLEGAVLSHFFRRRHFQSNRGGERDRPPQLNDVLTCRCNEI